MYKSNDKQPRYQATSNCKSFIGYYCYDLELELRLHLGKDLREDKGW